MLKTRMAAAHLAVAAALLGPVCASAAPADAPPAAPAAVAPKTTLGEVIVTARRRQEALQSVPIAISAYTSRQRDRLGVETVQDLAKFTPGMVYSSTLDRTFIRGVGRETASDPFTQPGVSVYLDDVYNASIIAASNDSLFLDRLEVLRGPQGALYGRNTIGGVINAISRRPTDSLYAEARTTLGNYGVYNVEGAVSGPVTDTVRFRLSGYRNDQEQGYFKDLSGLKSEGGSGASDFIEGQLDAKAGPVDIWVKALSYTFDTTLAPAVSPSPYDKSPFLPGTLSPNPAYGYTLPSFTERGTVTENPGVTDLRAFSHDTPSRAHLAYDFLGTAEVTWHWPRVDLKYIGGIVGYGYHSVQDEGFSVTAYLFPTEPSDLCSPDPQCPPLAVFPTTTINNTQYNLYFSNELDLKSTGEGRLQWIAGLFEFHQRASNSTGVTLPFQPQIATPLDPATGRAAAPNPSSNIGAFGGDMTFDSVAGFAQADWTLSDQVKLTGGLRYAYDAEHGVERARVLCFGLDDCAPASLLGAGTPALDITAFAVSYARDPGVAGPPTLDPATGVFSRRLSASWSGLTGVLGAEWTPNPDTLAYVKYTRGYKAGGFNIAGLAEAPETGPEFIDAYEAGLKHSLGGALALNAALFFYDYQGMQTPLTIRRLGLPDLGETVNLGHVQAYGFELEGVWTPTTALQVFLNYAYLNAKIRSSDCFVDPADPFALQAGARAAGCPADGSQNLRGETPPQSPPNRVVLGGNYTLGFAAGALTYDVDVAWTDRTYDEVFNRPYALAPAFDTVDMRLIWNDARGRFTGILFGKNILNALGYDDAEANLKGDGAIARYFGLTAPATYGIELQYRFR